MPPTSEWQTLLAVQAGAATLTGLLFADSPVRSMRPRTAGNARGLSLRTENVAALIATIKKFYETFSCH